MDDAGWLLITTAVSLIAGAVAGWVSAASRRREARGERIREEVLRWANPILNSVRGLESRLKNILEDKLDKALSPRLAGVDRPVAPDWAVSYEYVMPSTLFLFAEYFAWVQLMRERLSLEVFESQQSHKRFFDATWDVTNALSDWPLKSDAGKEQVIRSENDTQLSDSSLKRDAAEEQVVREDNDTQIFALQQRAIGELVIERDREPPRILTYRAFLDALDSDSDARFASLFQPLRSLLEDLGAGTKRWSRLECTFIALKALEGECRALLRLDSKN